MTWRVTLRKGDHTKRPNKVTTHCEVLKVEVDSPCLGPSGREGENVSLVSTSRQLGDEDPWVVSYPWCPVGDWTLTPSVHRRPFVPYVPPDEHRPWLFD